MQSLDLSMIPEGSKRTNAERTLSVIGKSPKQVSAIVEAIAKRFKNEDNHLSETQVKGALKDLFAANLVSVENVKTGTKGRPPKAYRLYSESDARAPETASA